jgi:hypothetical protein
MATVPTYRVIENCSLLFGRKNDWLLFPLFPVAESIFIEIKDDFTRD